MLGASRDANLAFWVRGLDAETHCNNAANATVY